MRARNAGGASAYSPIQTITTFLEAPTGVSATSTLNTVTVSWDVMDKALSYDVQFDGKDTLVPAGVPQSMQIPREASAACPRYFMV